MKRILYIVSTLRRSGPTTQLYNLIAYLDKGLYEPHLITLSPEDEDSCWDDFESLSVKLYSLKLSRIGGLLFAKSVLVKLVQKIVPDIIHTQGLRPDSLSASLSQYKIRFATQRNYPFDDYPMKFGGLQGSMMAYSHYRALKKIPYVVACSKTIGKLNKSHGLPGDYIQNGVNLSDTTGLMSSEERLSLKRTLGITPDALVFVSVGGLIRRKAVDVLIQAFLSIEQSKNVVLLILGHGQCREEYELLAEQSNRIRFAGQVSNVHDYLAISDCFVSASRSEGLPNTVIEALAEGLPVILSDIPSHKEVLEIDSLAGNLFTLNDVVELTGLMEAFMPDEKKSVAARKIVETKLNAHVMSQAYQQKYSLALK